MSRLKPSTLDGLLLRGGRGRFGRLWLVRAPSGARCPVILGGAPLTDHRAVVQELQLQLLAVPGGLPRRSGDVVPKRRVGADLNLVVGGEGPLVRLAREQVAIVDAERLTGGARHPYGHGFRGLVRSRRSGAGPLPGLTPAPRVLILGTLRSRL